MRRSVQIGEHHDGIGSVFFSLLKQRGEIGAASADELDPP
jgi:hypothetical protein